jgi:hypothetical protein
MQDINQIIKDNQTALNKAISTIYFNDRADYLRTLYSIVQTLSKRDNLNMEIIEQMFKELNKEEFN